MANILKIAGITQSTVDYVGGVISSNIQQILDIDWTTAPTQLTTPTNFTGTVGKYVYFSWDSPTTQDDNYVGSWEIWGGSGTSVLLASITHTAGSTTDSTYTTTLSAGSYYYKIKAVSNGTPTDSNYSSDINVVVS